MQARCAKVYNSKDQTAAHKYRQLVLDGLKARSRNNKSAGKSAVHMMGKSIIVNGSDNALRRTKSEDNRSSVVNGNNNVLRSYDGFKSSVDQCDDDRDNSADDTTDFHSHINSHDFEQ